MDTTTSPISFLIALIIILAVFLICRAIVLWYWKVDRIVGLLEQIESHLKPKSISKELKKESKEEVNNWEV